VGACFGEQTNQRREGGGVWRVFAHLQAAQQKRTFFRVHAKSEPLNSCTCVFVWVAMACDVRGGGRDVSSHTAVGASHRQRRLGRQGGRVITPSRGRSPASSCPLGDMPLASGRPDLPVDVDGAAGEGQRTPALLAPATGTTHTRADGVSLVSPPSIARPTRPAHLAGLLRHAQLEQGLLAVGNLLLDVLVR
jgi:hypothetical protein